MPASPDTARDWGANQPRQYECRRSVSWSESVLVLVASRTKLDGDLPVDPSTLVAEPLHKIMQLLGVDSPPPLGLSMSVSTTSIAQQCRVTATVQRHKVWPGSWARNPSQRLKKHDQVGINSADVYDGGVMLYDVRTVLLFRRERFRGRSRLLPSGSSFSVVIARSTLTLALSRQPLIW